MDKIQMEIWETVLKINRLWTKENKAEELKNYFHKDMVVLNPVDRERIIGGDACVAAWKNFTDNTKNIKWEEKEPDIRVHGGGRFAVVTYYFDMSYEMNGKFIEMNGRDMFVMLKENDKWYAVADEFSPIP